MTTKSPIRNNQTKLTNSHSVNNMSTNGNEIKSSRICVKRPLSTANFLPNNSTTNGFSNHLKKRTLQINHFFNSKIKPFRPNEQTNGHRSHDHSISPPLIFHAIAPASPDDIDTSSKQTDAERKSKSPASRRIANVLAHTKIKAMSTDHDSLRSPSSCSEDDLSKFHPVLSSIDADADESDNGNSNQLLKFRRFQKTRNSSLPQKSENTNERRHSSSNDDENNERRTKLLSMKKSDRKLTMTTTDDDMTKNVYRYHPLDNLESEIPLTTNESSSTPTVTISTNQPVVKKVNRFQVKSIRKSQQQQILLANAAAAKSSNEDDCSVPNDQSNLQLKPSIIERQHTNTPTTDCEHTTTNTDSAMNGTVSALNTVENGHHRVRFQVTVQEKKESTHEEGKLPHQTTTSTAPSSTASAPGEVSTDFTKKNLFDQGLIFF